MRSRSLAGLIDVLAEEMTAPIVLADAGGAAANSTSVVLGEDGSLATSEGVAQGFEAGLYRFIQAGGLRGRKIHLLGFLDDGFSSQKIPSNSQN